MIEGYNYKSIFDQVEGEKRDQVIKEIKENFKKYNEMKEPLKLQHTLLVARK